MAVTQNGNGSAPGIALSVSSQSPDPPKTKAEILKPWGRTGLKQYSGFIYEEYLPELAGRRGIDTYRKMSEGEAIVWSVLFAIELLMRQVSWNVEPAEGDDVDPRDAEKQAEFGRSVWSDMNVSWSTVLSDLLTFLPYGWSYLEIMYKQRQGDSFEHPETDSKYTDGLLGWSEFSIRSQDSLYRWDFNMETGTLNGLWQIPPPDYQTRYIAVQKALHFRTLQHKGNPEGRSVLRGAYRPWYFKQHLETIEAIGAERDLAGIPIIKAPQEIFSSNADGDQQALLAYLKKMVTSIKRDEQEGIVFPSSYDSEGKALYEIELLSTGGSRQFDTDKLIRRYSQEMAMTVLADFILLGHESVGTYALSSSKVGLFEVALGAFLDVITDVITFQGFRRLSKLNGFNPINAPKLVHGKVGNINLEELGAFIANLAKAGLPLFPNVELEKRVLEMANLPAPSEDDLKLRDQQSDLVAAQAELESTKQQLQQSQTSPASTDSAQGAAKAPPIAGNPAKPADEAPTVDKEPAKGDNLADGMAPKPGE